MYDIIREMIKIVLGVLFATSALIFSVSFFKNNKETKEVELKTRRRTSDSVTKAWLALYEDEKRAHKRDIKRLLEEREVERSSYNEKIEILEKQIISLQKDISLKDSILSRVKVYDVSKEHERQ